MENQTGPVILLPNETLLPVTHKNFFQKLPKNQQKSLLLISFLALFLPIVTGIALLATRLNSRAFLPATSPITSPFPTSITATPPITCLAIRSVLSKACVVSSKPTIVYQNGKPRRQTTTVRGNRTVSFTCPNGFSSTYTAIQCQTPEQLNIYVSDLCKLHSCQRPTLTPTPKPQSTPTPTISIQITPTPIASPSSLVNSSPVITTTFLPEGTAFQNYYVNIYATDTNNSDNLDMMISGLPFGLYQGPCAMPTAGGQISCSISGTPGKSGLYSISVKVTDNHLGSSSRLFSLFIKESITPSPTKVY